MDSSSNLVAILFDILNLFGLVAEEKTFYLWTIMFTYLGLVAAWIYYRNHGDEDNEKVEVDYEQTDNIEDECANAPEMIGEKRNHENSPKNEQVYLSDRCESTANVAQIKEDLPAELLTNFQDETGFETSSCERFVVSEIPLLSENSPSKFDDRLMMKGVDKYIDHEKKHDSFHLDDNNKQGLHISAEGIDDIRSGMTDELDCKAVIDSEFLNGVTDNAINKTTEIISGGGYNENKRAPEYDELSSNNDDEYCDLEMPMDASYALKLDSPNEHNLIDASLLSEEIKTENQCNDFFTVDTNFENITKIDSNDLIDNENLHKLVDSNKIFEDDATNSELLDNLMKDEFDSGEYEETNESSLRDDVNINSNSDYEVEDVLLAEVEEFLCEEDNDDGGDVKTEKFEEFEEEFEESEPNLHLQNLCDHAMKFIENEEENVQCSDMFFEPLGVIFPEHSQPLEEKIEPESFESVRENEFDRSGFDFEDYNIDDFPAKSENDGRYSPSVSEATVSHATYCEIQDVADNIAKCDEQEEIKSKCEEGDSNEYFYIETELSVTDQIDNNKEAIFADCENSLTSLHISAIPVDSPLDKQAGNCESNHGEKDLLAAKEVRISHKEAALVDSSLSKNFHDLVSLYFMRPVVHVDLLNDYSLQRLCFVLKDDKQAQNSHQKINFKSHSQSVSPAGNFYATCANPGILKKFVKLARSLSDCSKENTVTDTANSLIGRFGDFISRWTVDESEFKKNQGEFCVGDNSEKFRTDSFTNETSSRRTSSSSSEFDGQTHEVDNDYGKIRQNPSKRNWRSADDYVFVTSLAAVNDDSYSDLSTSGESTESLHDRGLDVVLDCYELYSDNDTSVNKTNFSCNRKGRRLKRLSSSESTDVGSPKRFLSQASYKERSHQEERVSQSFDIPFERKYEFEHNEIFSRFFDFQAELDEYETDSCDSDVGVYTIETCFDVNNSTCEAQKQQNTFVDSVTVNELYVEPVIEGYKCEPSFKMGQTTSSLLGQKGTLAMPVTDSFLRGIYIRNQGEYAIINRKTTRFSPLISEISVDRRLRITVEVPSYQIKAQEVTTDIDEKRKISEYLGIENGSLQSSVKGDAFRRFKNDPSSNSVAVDRNQGNHERSADTQEKALDAEIKNSQKGKEVSIKQEENADQISKLSDEGNHTEHETADSVTEVAADSDSFHADTLNPNLITKDYENVDQEDSDNAPNHLKTGEHSVENNPEINIEYVDKLSEKSVDTLSGVHGTESLSLHTSSDALDSDSTVEIDGLRSKSLSSLPKVKLDPMAWFYRNHRSSAYLEDVNSKAIDFGQLRKVKSAEIARKKPKITLSANFKSRSIKETDLDALMKSLETIGAVSNNDIANSEIENEKEAEPCILQNDIKENHSEMGENLTIPTKRVIQKAKSTGLLNHRSELGLGLKKENDSVANLIKKFDSSRIENGTVFVSMDQVYSENKQITKSWNLSSPIDKNSKHSIRERSTPSLNDVNNNRTAANNHHNSITRNDKSGGGLENKISLETYSLKTNSMNSISRKDHLRSENSSQTKEGLERREKTRHKDNKNATEPQEKGNAKHENIEMVDGIATTYKQKFTTIHGKNVMRTDRKQDNNYSKDDKEQDEEGKRTSIYGLTVALSEISLVSESEIDPTAVNGEEADPGEYWLEITPIDSDSSGHPVSKSTEKVMDIDMILNTANHTDDGTLHEYKCVKCGEQTETSKPCSCSLMPEEILKKESDKESKSTSKVRNSFRREKRLRKWLEEKQNSLSFDETAKISDKSSAHQSKRLKQIAIAEGINISGLKDHNIEKAILNKLESENKFTDFITQLRYLINLNDDENIGNTRSSITDVDPVALLKEYEISRQLRKGRSPFTSDDEGNDSDAFTDITDTTFSDYTRSRTSLNSLSWSRGSLHRPPSTDPEEEVSSKQDERDGNDVASRASNHALEEVRASDSKEQVLNDAAQNDIASDLILQAASAVRNRRGRSNRARQDFAKEAESKEVSNNARSTAVISGLETSKEIETSGISYSPIKTLKYEESKSKRNKHKTHIDLEKYVDSPCSLLTERINNGRYSNLSSKNQNLLEKNTRTPSQTSENVAGNPMHGSADISMLPSPVIRKLENSPRQRRRAEMMQEYIRRDRATSESELNATQPLLGYKRSSPFRKSTGSYQRDSHRSLPNLDEKQQQGERLVHQTLQSSSNTQLNSNTRSSLRSPVRSPTRSPTRSPFRSPLRSPIRSPSRSPYLSELEEDFYECETNYSDMTSFFSDSSLDTGVAFDGEEDVFFTPSPRRRNFSSDLSDFAARQDDECSSGEFFVPLNTSTNSQMPHESELLCAFPPCRNKDYIDALQRTYFTSCVACFTFYCSKECRRAHWKEHKQTCYFGRVNYYTKSLIRRFETNSAINEKLSEIAYHGFQNGGRGCVLITFSSPMAAKFFLVSGTELFPTPPLYSTIRDAMDERIKTKHQVLLLQTMHDYIPENEFIVNLTVFIGKQNEVRASPSRLNSTALLRCTKIPISTRFKHVDLEPRSEASYDIKVFYLPRSQRHHFVNDIEARRYYCREVSYGLRKYGIQLKLDYPDVYDKLCLYVEHDTDFAPITLYGQADKKNYKCIIFPEGFSEPSKSLELQGRGMIV